MKNLWKHTCFDVYWRLCVPQCFVKCSYRHFIIDFKYGTHCTHCFGACLDQFWCWRIRCKIWCVGEHHVQIQPCSACHIQNAPNFTQLVLVSGETFQRTLEPWRQKVTTQTHVKVGDHDAKLVIFLQKIVKNVEVFTCMVVCTPKKVSVCVQSDIN